MKFDSLKNKKISLSIYLIAISVILLFALIFGLIFGFNKGFDFVGGTQITVDFAEDSIEHNDKNLTYDEYLKEVSSTVKDIISSNGGKIHSFQVQDIDGGTSFVVTIRQKSPSTLKQIRLELNREFNDFSEYKDLADDEKYKILDQYFDITKNTSAIESLILPNTIIACIAGLLTVLTAVFVYCCFRLKLASSLTLLFGGILNLVVFCALMILSRIEINAYFFALLALILLVSIYNSLNFFFDIKEKLKDPKLNSKSNKELAEIVLKEDFIKNISVYAVCLAIALIFGIFGVVSILHLGLATILGLVILFVTHSFILPEVWILLNKKNEYIRPIPKQKKNEVEVMAGKNNADKLAKVVEVDEEQFETAEDSNDKVEIVSEDNVSSDDDDEVTIEVVEDDDEDSKKD